MEVRELKRKRKPKKYDEEDEIDRLQKEIRELKATNRSLVKQLKKLTKGFNKEEQERLMDTFVNEEKEAPDDRSRQGNSRCSHCGKGFIIETDVAGRIFHSCNTCDYKSGRPINKKSKRRT